MVNDLGFWKQVSDKAVVVDTQGIKPRAQPCWHKDIINIVVEKHREMADLSLSGEEIGEKELCLSSIQCISTDKDTQLERASSEESRWSSPP